MHLSLCLEHCDLPVTHSVCYCCVLSHTERHVVLSLVPSSSGPCPPCSWSPATEKHTSFSKSIEFASCAIISPTVAIVSQRRAHPWFSMMLRCRCHTFVVTLGGLAFSVSLPLVHLMFKIPYTLCTVLFALQVCCLHASTTLVTWRAVCTLRGPHSVQSVATSAILESVASCEPHVNSRQEQRRVCDSPLIKCPRPHIDWNSDSTVLLLWC